MMAKTLLRPLQAHAPHKLADFLEKDRVENFYPMTVSKYLVHILHKYMQGVLGQGSPTHEPSRRRKQRPE